MDKPTVNDCNVCAEDGWYNVKDDRIEPRETCPNCSGAGRVVGVPADSIVVADDTGRVAVFERINHQAAVMLAGEEGRFHAESMPTAVVNLALDAAGETPDYSPEEKAIRRGEGEEAPDGNE